MPCQRDGARCASASPTDPSAAVQGRGRVADAGRVPGRRRAELARTVGRGRRCPSPRPTQGRWSWRRVAPTPAADAASARRASCARTKRRRTTVEARRREWMTVRAAVHLALAERGSTVALYDLRETIERASRRTGRDAGGARAGRGRAAASSRLPPPTHGWPARRRRSAGGGNTCVTAFRAIVAPRAAHANATRCCGGSAPLAGERGGAAAAESLSRNQDQESAILGVTRDG